LSSQIEGDYTCDELATNWGRYRGSAGGRLAIELLSCPATTSPVERIFSAAGFMTRLHRNRSDEALINCQLMLHVNKELMDEAQAV